MNGLTKLDELAFQQAVCADTHFVYDPNDGFTTYASAEEAKAAANRSFADYRIEAINEGWNEEVDELCWGVISERVAITKTINRPPPEELDGSGMDKAGNYWSGEFDSMIDRELLPVKGGAQ